MMTESVPARHLARPHDRGGGTSGGDESDPGSMLFSSMKPAEMPPDEVVFPRAI